MKFEEYFTERLILRKLEPGDFRFIFEHYPEAEIRNLLGIHSDAEYEKELNKYRNGYSTHNRSFVFFQMIDRVTGIMIGGGGFHNWCTDHFRAELGYAISDEDYKGKGLMTEALAFIIEYGFTKMNLRRIEAFISPQNIPSLKLIAKYDFTKEGCLRQHYYKDDKMEDSLVFSLLKTEYPQREKNCDQRMYPKAMIKIIRTNSDDPHFRELVKLLDRDLKTRDGDDHDFYAQYNKLDAIQHTIVAYINDVPAGCGAIKFYSNETAEVKRMFVHPAHRRQGIAAGILASLESWARELGYSQCILETGKLQPEAIALYRRSGYTIIPNYGQYERVENSVCMKKQLAEI